MGDNKLVITTEPNTFHVDLPKDAGINLKYKIYSIVHTKQSGGFQIDPERMHDKFYCSKLQFFMRNVENIENFL